MMKRILIACCGFALMVSFAAASYAYTLTVKSANPGSGVAITVSPSDNQGRSSGTTQFRRRYGSGTSVTLTAPAAPVVSGKTYYFVKWTNGSADFTADRSATIRVTSNVTMTAVFTATPPIHTLTVASLNPGSGVPIIIAPADSQGRGNGSTQFTRSYIGGMSVTLTAPLSAGGGSFQKWQKDSKDFVATRSATVTMSANTTMTAVYSAGPVSSHSTLTWNGQTMCLDCHVEKAFEVAGSAHYRWEGLATYMVSGSPVQGKLKTAVNSYCGNIIGNWNCSSCHVGLGKRPDDTVLSTQQHLENIDCLLCHQKDYKRKKDAVTGLMVPDTAGMGVTLDTAVRTVHKPVRQNCTQCHAKGGGGDNFKRGDLAVAHAATTDRNFDVHMAATPGGNLACQTCHTVQQHRIAGRGSDLRETDLDVRMTCSTSTCHSSKSTSTGHATTDVNKHINRIACQTCHIGSYARNASDTAASEATEVKRDWSIPEWSAANNRYEPTVTLMNNLKPEYKFWNGTSWGYSLNDNASIDPATGRFPTSRPIGDFNDVASKLYPFKYKIAVRPYATGLGKLIPVDTKVYFSTGNSAAAIQSSLSLMGHSPAEPYSWVEDDTYQLITHEVPPAAGNAMTCTSCHVSATASQMNLKSLGYATKKPTSDLCNDCHGSQSYDGSYSRFTWVHNKHVNQELYKCSRCHNFDRPERTNLR